MQGYVSYDHRGMQRLAVVSPSRAIRICEAYSRVSADKRGRLYAAFISDAEAARRVLAVRAFQTLDGAGLKL